MKWPSSEGQLERVKGAVVKYAGENFEAENHMRALNKVIDRYGAYDSKKEEGRGWMTTKGRMVSEEEARAIEIRYKARTGKDSELEKDPESTLFKDKND